MFVESEYFKVFYEAFLQFQEGAFGDDLDPQNP